MNDVTSVGQRFVMQREDAVERRRIHLIMKWPEELKRIVPTEN